MADQISKNTRDQNANRRHGGALLFVAIKLYHSPDQQLPVNWSPHVYGSTPLLGSWDTAGAIAMEQVSEQVWELDFVVPPRQETLEFKFLFKDLDHIGRWITEEGPNWLLVEGIKERDAKFKFLGGMEEYEIPVSVQADFISAFSLGTNWRDCKGNVKVHASMEQGNPDVKLAGGSSLTLEPPSSPILELSASNHKAQFPVSATNDAVQYPADAKQISLQSDQSVLTSVPPAMETSQLLKPSNPGSSMPRNRCVSVQDLLVLGSESANTDAVLPEMEFSKEDAFNTGVGQSASSDLSSIPPHFMERSVSASSRDSILQSCVDLINGDDVGTKKGTPETMARGTAAMIDQILLPKERRRLAIVMVGLPARGKTFTAAKLMRYLRWLGHVTKFFNVGKYRRLKHGCNQSADFFRGDNQEGLDARNEVAAVAMNDMLTWLQEGGQIGIFDATNSTVQRRKMLLNMAEGKCKVIFLEIICNDQTVIDRNIRLKILQSPDYIDVADFEEALKDFKDRLANYEKVYEPVFEGSYIKMIDTVTGEKGQLQVNNISGYLPGRILFFLVNTHTNPRPILLTRDGETFDNMQGRIGGDQCLSEVGEIYAKKLADFVNEQFKGEQTASVWTSTLQRTVSTARHLDNFPKVEWRALDDINAGICEGMTYQEIEDSMPEEFEARKLDKLQYRYPHGESYLDVIQRLEPVIIELERQQSPVFLVAHQAVLRSLYGYFADIPVKDIPHIEIPLHTVIVIQMGLLGVEEKRHKLL